LPIKQGTFNMKQLIFIRSILIALLLSSTANATGPRVSPSLISTASDIYTVRLPPIIDPGNQYACYLGEVVYKVLHQQKIDAVLSSVPLLSMLKYYLFKDNALAVLSPYLHLSESQKEDLIIIPIDSIQESYIYYKPHHPNGLAWKGNLNNLKGLRFGTIKGDQVKKFQQAGINVKTTRIDNLLNKLVANEIDFIRLPDVSLDSYIKENFSNQKDNFEKMKISAGAMSLAIIFNKKHPKGEEMAEKFKQGIKLLIQGGQFQQIKSQYF